MADPPAPWWTQSQTIRALLLALAGIIGGIAGKAFLDDAQTEKIIEGITTLVSIGGVLWAAHGRSRTQDALVASRTETTVAKAETAVATQKVQVATEALADAGVAPPSALTAPVAVIPTPPDGKVP